MGEEVDVGGLLNRAIDAARPYAGQILQYSLLLLAAVVALYVVFSVLRRRRRKLPLAEPDLTIDVSSLGVAGPPPGAPVLEHYNLPMRLAAIVVAPAGRARRLPPPEQLGRVFEAIVPGLSQVVQTHNTLVRQWPAQLSTHGFAHAFFRHARLPGDGGKGTVWCSAAGVVRIQDEPVMAALLMQSDAPNTLGHTVVEHETKWLDVVRVRLA